MTRAFAVALACLVALGPACSSDGRVPSGSPSATLRPVVSGEPIDFGVVDLTDAKGSANCGRFAVSWRNPPIGEGGDPATLTAVDGADVALDVKGKDHYEQLTPLWCGDVTGDGRAEIAVQRFTGGAHCCFAIRVDTLGGRTLLDRDFGNDGGLAAKQLDGAGAEELVGTSDVLAYFGDLPYVATAPVPLVFAFRGGRYVEATTDFPNAIRDSLKQAEKDLDTAMSDKFDEAIKGMALGVYAHHVLLGDADDALAQLQEQLPDAIGAWLREHADEAARLVRGEATPAPK